MLPRTMTRRPEATPRRLGHSTSAMYFYRWKPFVNLFICFHLVMTEQISVHVPFACTSQESRRVDTRKTPLLDRRLTLVSFSCKIFSCLSSAWAGSWAVSSNLSPFPDPPDLSLFSTPDEFIIALQTHAARK